MIAQLESHPQCVILFSETAAIDSVTLKNSNAIIIDILLIVVRNINLRFVKAFLSLDTNDYPLITRLVRLAIFLIVSFNPNRDPENVRKALSRLDDLLNLMSLLFSYSIPRYFYPHSENYKYPLRNFINMATLSIPTCAEPYLLNHLKQMIKSALDSAVSVCDY